MVVVACNSLSLTLSISLTHSFYLSLTLFLSLSHTLSISLSHSFYLSHTPFLSLTHTLSICLSHSFYFSLTLFLSLSHTRSISLSHSFYLSLTLFLSLSQDSQHGCLSRTHTNTVTQVRATNYRALLQKMTYKDKASYGSWSLQTPKLQGGEDP